MSGSQQGKRAITRSGYWLAMLINIVLCAGLLIGGIISLIGGNWGIGLLMLAAIAPIGMYFRVIMMRRCRDIGWPAFLPWVLFGAGFLANLMAMGSAFGDLSSTFGELNSTMAGDSGGDIGAASAFSALGPLPLVIGLVDLGLMIALGCIAGKSAEDYQDVFGSGSSGSGSGGFKRTAPASGEYDSPEAEHAGWDAAIQRALDKQAQDDILAKPGQAVGTSQAMAQPAGFGRKGL